MSPKPDDVQQTFSIHTIIPIHGTFAADGSWWRPGSEFCKMLDASLEAKGSPARCWAHLEHRPGGRSYQAFQWSGLNTEIGRRTDAAYLMAYLIALCWNEEVKSIHLVCHSHAGNLLYYAMSNRYFDNSYIRAKIHSVTFLGTPFLKSQRFGSDFVAPQQNPSRKANLFFVETSDNYRPKERIHALNRINTQSIYYAADEAFTLLRHARAIREDPGFYGFDPSVSFRMVLTSIIPNFYRKAFSTTRVFRRLIHPRRQVTPPHVLGMTIPLTEDGIIAWLRSYVSVEMQSYKSAWQHHPSKTFVAVIALLSPLNIFLCMILFLADYAILSPLYLAKRKLGRAIERVGLRSVAKTILGDNFMFDTISEIRRAPIAVSGCTVVELEAVPGPQTDLVLNSVTTSMAQFYKLDHGPLATKIDVASLLDRASKIFVDPYLLHCRYYYDPAVIQLIVVHIGREPSLESEKRNAVDLVLGTLANDRSELTRPTPAS